MAILRRFNGKPPKVPKVHAIAEKQSTTKSQNFGLRYLRRSTRRQAQNALGIFNKVLHKSMTTVRQQLNKSFVNDFFKKTTQKIRTLIMTTKQQIGLGDSVTKDATNQVEKPSIILIGLNLLHRFLCLCVRFILIKTHGEHGPSMPPIDDLLLLESATSIAEKIRTNKVGSSS